MWCKLVVCLTLVSMTLAAVAIAPLDPKPDEFAKMPGCYIKELHRVIPLKERATSRTSCMQYMCGEQYVQHFTCGAVHAAAPCRLVTHATKPYPDCCPKIVC